MSNQERTEQATEKRLKEVRSQGRLQKSRDLVAWISVAVVVALIPSTISRAQAAAEQQILGVADVIKAPSAAEAMRALASGLGSVAATVWPMLVVAAVTTIAVTAVQGGIHPKKFTPKFEHFNLLAGIRTMFGTRSAWELAKALAKAGIVGLGIAAVIQGLIPIVAASGSLSIPALLSTVEGSVGTLLTVAIGGGLLFAAIDVFVIIRRNRMQTRMTKREVKDEHKSSEGDPMVRAQRRSRHLAMSRNRMIAAVADASVVLVNPTHVAVALRYEAGTSAPRVVAKGADLIATRIREEAAANRVPMVKDIPLARSLYAACDVGQEIPVELFTPIAQVLAFVMLLTRRGGSLTDIHEMTTDHVPAHAGAGERMATA
ncbi:EscU/YscU/HrcU family type III secretion system export apparatus switch protein [Curtobacterium ammoniigenes]|uniref:EscU/YscU/HrcU family type III secretion system export apparatus switch protein n=1 Tax=Curtobacterium ammoniigenes TaxID=395387 RepID=UPI00082D550E|nr:EscU/YscU/HrcU family type III secretion system export apparatus switch protein [Curtobacterium ammoniigenes]